MMKKDVYPFKNTNDRKKLSETSLPRNQDFYINLNIGDVTKKDWEDFGIKNLGKYHDLYVRSNTVLFVDVICEYVS